MKIKSSMIMLVFAALAVNLHAASKALPAPLPEFMNQQQLATWNAEHASAKPTIASAQEDSTQFYTGKPYVADAGGYVYKYRTYNPEMSRWTSADPSGFPDGDNNNIYVVNPITHFDSNGFVDDTILSVNKVGTSDVYQAILKEGSSLLNLTYQLSFSLTAAPTLVPGSPVLGGTNVDKNAIFFRSTVSLGPVAPTISILSSTPGTDNSGQPDITYVGTITGVLDTTHGWGFTWGGSTWTWGSTNPSTIAYSDTFSVVAE